MRRIGIIGGIALGAACCRRSRRRLHPSPPRHRRTHKAMRHPRSPRTTRAPHRATPAPRTGWMTACSPNALHAVIDDRSGPIQHPLCLRSRPDQHRYSHGRTIASGGAHRLGGRRRRHASAQGDRSDRRAGRHDHRGTRGSSQRTSPRRQPRRATPCSVFPSSMPTGIASEPAPTRSRCRTPSSAWAPRQRS